MARKREHSSLLPHAEPFKHFIDDILRRIFAGEVTESIQRIVHTDRYGIQPEPAADRIQRTGHCIPRAGGGGKLALAREAGSVGVDVVGAQQAGNGSGDHPAAPPFLAADREHHGKIACNDLCVKLSGLVLFVDQCNGRAAGTPLRQRKILPGQGLRAIEHRQDQSRLFQLFPAAADAFGLDRILGLPQTGRVEQVQPDVPQPDGLLHHIPWRAPPGMTHNTTLPFTRYLAGAGDYTLCYFNNRVKNTKAHQLAMAAVYYSPLQFMFWYDRPEFYQGEEELEFWKAIPSVWDDSRALDGEIGEYIVQARRSGNDWFVGAMTNTEARTITLTTDFLEPGKKYMLHLYEDDDKLNTRTKVRSTHKKIKAGDKLVLKLKANGGAALHFTPLKK